MNSTQHSVPAKAGILAQFVRFGVVGSIGASVDFGSYGIMTRLLGWDKVYCFGFSGTSYTTILDRLSECTTPNYPLVAANMLSVFLAITSNFVFNKFWTFRDPRTSNIAVQGISYFVMSAIAWVLNQILTGIFASRLIILHALFGHAVDIAAKILAVLVVLFFNFGVSKFVIFRQHAAGARQ